jgi:hypothetical protein
MGWVVCCWRVFVRMEWIAGETTVTPPLYDDCTTSSIAINTKSLLQLRNSLEVGV